MTLQLRLEVYNIFNNLNFRTDTLNRNYAAQNVAFGDRNGNVVGGNSADRYQILSADPPSNFGQYSAARDPRTLQLGVRLSF